MTKQRLITSIKKMEQIIKKTKWLLILSLVIACNNKKNKNLDRDNKYDNNISKILSISFPDTVRLNTVVEGQLQYDLNNIGFDSDSISSRFLHLILTTNRKEKLLGYNQMEKDYLLGYVDSIPTGKFKFAAVFEKKGKQMLNIAIRDNMFLKHDGELSEDEMKLRTADCLFSKEVYVIE
ncbi:hypothetical protein [Flavobacterium sp. PL002]